MSYEHLGKVVDTWMNDPVFRNALRSNPDAALRDRGFSLSNEELATLKRMDWSKSDRELESLISKPIL